MCTSAIRCLFEFQTLLSGCLAILAAILTAAIIWRAAQLPIKEQAKRDHEMKGLRRQYACLVLSTDFHLIAARARQAEGTIRAVIAANANVNDNTREKTYLKLHPMIDQWEFMSLLPKDMFRNIMRLRRTVDDHNFDMERAGGAFGAENFRQSILTRIRSIQGHATTLAAQIAVLG